MDDSFITVHIWLPIDYFGHCALSIDEETYISFYPNNDGAEERTKGGKNTLGNRNWTYSDNYDEDCKYLGKKLPSSYRKSDQDVKLKLPKEPIKDFWYQVNENHRQYNYNLLHSNCSTVVAQALNIGYRYSLEKLNTLQIKIVENYHPEIDDNFKARDYVKLNILKLFKVWTPEHVLNFAKFLKLRLDLIEILLK